MSLGQKLIDLHLLDPQAPPLQKLGRGPGGGVSYPINGSDRVKRRGGFPKFIPAGQSRTKTSEVAEQNRVYINLEQYFAGVPAEVWEFEVGGYQVLHKWLKDRKGRKLSLSELMHYQKIVVPAGDDASDGGDRRGDPVVAGGVKREANPKDSVGGE